MHVSSGSMESRPRQLLTTWNCSDQSHLRTCLRPSSDLTFRDYSCACVLHNILRTTLESWPADMCWVFLSTTSWSSCTQDLGYTHSDCSTCSCEPSMLASYRGCGGAPPKTPCTDKAKPCKPLQHAALNRSYHLGGRQSIRMSLPCQCALKVFG